MTITATTKRGRSIQIRKAVRGVLGEREIEVLKLDDLATEIGAELEETKAILGRLLEQEKIQKAQARSGRWVYRLRKPRSNDW